MRLLKLVVVLLVIWGVSSTVQTALRDLRQNQFDWTLQAGWLVLAGLLYFIGMLPCAIFWHRILLAMGQRPGFLETLWAYHIGHWGKYVPGKAMVVVLRAGLLKSGRVDAAVAAASVFLETMTMMAVGAFLSAGILLFILPQHWLLLLVAAGLMVAAGLPTLPPVYRRLVRLVLGKMVDKEVPLERITFRLMAGGWLGVACGWCVVGLSLWATLRGMDATIRGMDQAGPVSLLELPRCVASTALAVVAGFVSLIPGGAVVRELILTQVLATRFSDATALVSAVLLRLIWLLSELAFSVILYITPKGPRARQPVENADSPPGTVA